MRRFDEPVGIRPAKIDLLASHIRIKRLQDREVGLTT